MGKIYSIITALLMAVGTAVAAEPSGYEWWFDNDVSTLQTGTVTGFRFDLPIDLSDLPPGTHYFNCRLHTDDGTQGSVYRKMFFSVDNTVGAVAYEYWLDSNYAAKTTGEIADGNVGFEIDTSKMLPGLHTFNCRLYTNQGGWGATYRRLVLTTGSQTDITAYEYWIDNNYDSKTEGAVTSGANAYAIDLQGVRKGLHRVNYRLRTSAGVWGAVYSKYFFYATAKTPFTYYEYWLDNDYANHKSGTTATNPVSFEVDLSDYDKSGEAHYFNMRVRDDDGDWSSFYRKLLVFYKADKKAPLVGYRHNLNGTDLGYVKVDRQITDKYTFTVDLPDDLGFSMKDKELKFEGDKVSIGGNDSIHYTLQIESEIGWGAPTTWDFEATHNFSTTAQEMAVNSSRTFNRPASGEFVAVKFTAADKALYVRSDREVALDLYRNGNKVKEISGTDVEAMTKLELEAGVYFGILHSAEESETGQFTFHLMDTPNTVPTPSIEFNDGRVTITCSREDAEIYYTLDGSAPAPEREGSTRYTEPFALDRNATIKAVAVLADSDIEPSAIAELVVNSYRVADPVVKFENLMLVITAEAREGVRTYYTLDGTEPTQESTEYNAPFSLSGNAKVLVRSFKEGYNPSNVVEYNHTHSIYVTGAPDIKVEGTTVTLTATTEGSTLYYGINNPDTEAMAEYVSPFEMSSNGTVYAQARKDGMYDSEVVSVEINGNKVPTPQISCTNHMVKITCANGEAKIYYTLDESAPTESSTLYESEFEFDRNGVIKAVAIDPTGNLEPSDIGELVIDDNKVVAPVISFDNLMITITQDQREGVHTYYTLDGKEPTEESDEYNAPFSVSGNVKVRARSFKAGYHPSEIAEYNYIHSVYVTGAPEISVENNIVTLTATTEGSTLYYGINNPDTEAMAEYVSPFEMSGNGTVYAQARKEGMYDSEVVSETISTTGEKCADVAIGYDGRYVTLTTEEPDAEIRYTLDGSNPVAGNVYSGKFDAMDIVTVKAVAMKEDYLNSEIAEYPVRVYADEEQAKTTHGGILEEGYAWSDGGLIESMDKLRVEGYLNADDYSFIRSMKSLRHLDIEKVTTESVPDGGFAGLPLVAVSMPEHIGEYGANLFPDNDALCAIIWNSTESTVEEHLMEGVSNPNLLLYVKESSLNRSKVTNLVASGHAAAIILTDRQPFYAPLEFDAETVSYTRNFSKETEIGGCTGWETLTVPFDVKTISDSNGEIHPFASSGEAIRHFWLYAPIGTGWGRRGEIAAYEPYLIAMPNNPMYIDDYNISGDVTFSATNVVVGATPEPTAFPYRNGGEMWPNYANLMAGEDLWVVNDDWVEGNAPGSVFGKGLRDVRPFECYLTYESSRRYLPIFDESEVETLLSRLGTKIWCENHDLCIFSGISQRVNIYDPVGQLVRVADVRADEICRVHDLAPGVYIVGTVKIMVK